MSACPDGSWSRSSDRSCPLCYNTFGPTYYPCNTCLAGNAYNQCTSCSGSFLYNGECLNPCPTGYWGQSSDWTCHQCYTSGGSSPYSCATCSAASNNNCNSCNSPYYLYGGQCLASCPTGYFGSSNVCYQCYTSSSIPYSCATCLAGAYNNCDSCNSPYYLYPNTGGQCLGPCPDGYWGQSSDWTCQQCYTISGPTYYPCSTCSAGNAYNQCTSCSGYYLYSGECLSSCPNGYYISDSTCQQCFVGSSPTNYSCTTCSAGSAYNQCTSCSSGYFLYSGECLSSCPTGYWGRSSDWTCQQCYTNFGPTHYPCSTCSAGNAYNQCTSCSSEYSLYSGECLSSCPTGYWSRSPDWTCQQCYTVSGSTYYPCFTCSAGNAYNQCESCSGYYLYSGACLISCPTGYWDRSLDWTCQPCYATSGPTYYPCSTCSTGNAYNQCTSCFSGYYLYSGECLSSCPAGYYISGSTCQQCYTVKGPSYASCSTCSAGNAYNQCTACFSGYYFFSGECLSSCPTGYWGQSSDWTCQQCYNISGPTYYPCYTCSGGSAYNQCTSCSSDDRLSDGECLSSCSPGYYLSDSTCQQCYNTSGPTYYSCYTCSGGGAYNQCTSCASGYYLYSGKCLRSCLTSYYWNSTYNTCQPCYSSSSSPYSCATCSKGDSINCNSCNSPYYLYPNTGGQCLATCPTGYEMDTINYVCRGIRFLLLAFFLIVQK